MRFPKIETLAGLTISLNVVLLTSGSAQVADPEGEARYGPRYWLYSPTAKIGNAWTFKPWIDDAVTFSATRRQIESSYAKNGAAGEAEIRRFRQAAEQSPKNALLQYRWAYASFLRGRWLGDRGMNRAPIPHKRTESVRWALALAEDPRSAEYARMRFLADAAGCKPDLIRPLARRLLVRWPDDLYIKRAYAQALLNSKQRSDFELAIQIGNELAAKAPQRAGFVGLISGVYFMAWNVFHKREDGLACIKETKNYLGLLPPDSPDAKDMKEVLANMSRQLGAP